MKVGLPVRSSSGVSRKQSQQSATMMTDYGSPSSPSGELSIESDDLPIANIVTGPRKKRRIDVSAIASPRVELGANHLDLSNHDGSPVSGGSPASESEAIYAEMKNIVGPELVTEIKQWSDNDVTRAKYWGECLGFIRTHYRTPG
jgi:hypothetical protein